MSKAFVYRAAFILLILLGVAGFFIIDAWRVNGGLSSKYFLAAFGVALQLFSLPFLGAAFINQKANINPRTYLMIVSGIVGGIIVVADFFIVDFLISQDLHPGVILGAGIGSLAIFASPTLVVTRKGNLEWLHKNGDAVVIAVAVVFIVAGLACQTASVFVA
ncbi:MAG: hypothetical protein IH860_04945 [Chloroflexi bacterium]|nr:hypothetical protein [Chloroflexota bacterium]